MATYSSRITELRDLMTQATAGADERVVRALTQCIDRYNDMRQRALDDLVDFIAKASIGNVGTQAKWESRINSVRAEYNRLFGDAVKDIALPPPVQLFWFAALQAEETFFERLSKVNTPQLLDDILKHQDGLSKLIGELQDGWKFVLTNDKVLEDDQMRAIKQVDEMVQQIISELDGVHRKLLDNTARMGEAAQKKVEEWKSKVKEKLGPAGEWVETAVTAVKEYILDQLKPEGLQDDFKTQMEAAKQQAELAAQLLVERVRLHRSLVQTYQSLVSTEKGGVLTMFKKTKDEVDGYIKTNDVAHAKVWVDQARGQLADWVSSLPSSRQKDDAGSFRDEIYKHIESDWKITEDLDKKFRDQFQGVFLSPLSNETVETLAEQYLFRQQLQVITGRGATAKLDEYRAKLPAHAESMEKALQPTEEVVASLPPEVQELAKLRNKDFQAFVRERIKRQMEALLPTIEDLTRMLEPSNVERDFNRDELERMLR
jgi:hypothetical protein